MNNRPTLFTRIRNIIVGTIMPKYLEDLWLDVSNGEKNAVLKYKGNPIAGGGAGSSNSDYTVTRSLVTLDNESVTTIKNELDVTAYGEFANPTELEEGYTYIVIFDGVEYQCVARKEGEVIEIGAITNFPDTDFSEYPFIIGDDYFDGEHHTYIITENPGTYQVEIKELSIDSITVSDDFSAAVEYVSETLPSLKLATVVLNNEDDWTAGFKIYFQKECIYDTDKLSITPEVIIDNETASFRISSGNRRSIPKELFNIDALLFSEGSINTILYKNSYRNGGMGGPFIDFSSVNQIEDGNTIINGSNYIHIWQDVYS